MNANMDEHCLSYDLLFTRNSNKIIDVFAHFLPIVNNFINFGFILSDKSAN